MSGSATGPPSMVRRLRRLGVQWPWILLAAGAVLLSAAGYLLFTAFRFARDAPTLIGGPLTQDGLAEPDGLAKHAAAVIEFRSDTPALLVLLAVMLLAGCRVLTGALPTTVRVTSGGNAELAGGSRLRQGLLALAATAGLFALAYAATAAVALTFHSPLLENTPEQTFLESNSITALAISLAALILLVSVFLSRWVPGAPPASPDGQDEQEGSAVSPMRRPAPETAEMDAPQTSLSSSPDLIEGGRG